MVIIAWFLYWIYIRVFLFNSGVLHKIGCPFTNLKDQQCFAHFSGARNVVCRKCLPRKYNIK